MDRVWWFRGYRLFFGILAIVAIGYQLEQGKGSTANFFSFFTIQSNLIGAVVLILGGLLAASWIRDETLTWSLVRAGAALYLMLTGVIYNTLLTDVDVQTSSWVNDVVHKILPVVMLTDFVLVPLANRITFRQGLIWTLYPLAYLAYSLIRGPIVDWYPYPFLDPRKDGGYPRVALFCVVILIGFLGVTWLLLRFNDWRLDRRQIVGQAR